MRNTSFLQRLVCTQRPLFQQAYRLFFCSKSDFNQKVLVVSRKQFSLSKFFEKYKMQIQQKPENFSKAFELFSFEVRNYFHIHDKQFIKVLGTRKTQFWRPYRNFFRQNSRNFSIKVLKTYRSTTLDQKFNFLTLLLRTLRRQFRQSCRKFFTGDPRIVYRIIIFLLKETSSKVFSTQMKRSFDNPADIFLLEDQILLETSSFFKK